MVLRAANKLSDDVDMSVVEEDSYAYYRRALETGEHIAYLVYDNGKFIGAGGVSFYQVMPTYHNSTGKKAYIMNMYTVPEYRRQGIVWKQLGDIRDKKILDFGSGIGVTANYLAEHNDVTAIEPDEDSIKERWADNQYTQITGSTDELHKFADETFDMIICHNVLEYVEDRADIVKEFARVLKLDGKISIVKHNRAGRVMQMVVLLNDFEQAHNLLDGNDGMASKYGAIHYYEDSDMDGYKDIAFFHHLMIEKK